MKSDKALLISALLLLSLFRSQAAEPAGEAGGLPTLGARVGALEITVEDQGTAGAELGIQVEDLQSQLSAMQNDLLTLESKLPMFAVVNADGTLRASRGVQSAGQSLDGSGNPLTGHYDVIFHRNVSLCAVTVTAEPSFSGQITASVNGTFRGSPIHDPNRFIIVLSDEDGHRINSRFNVIVTC
jgi:hypothetical protein